MGDTHPVASRRRFLAGAVIAAVSLTGRYIGRADAGEARTSMPVTAHVVQTVRIRSMGQAATVAVTAQDIERGFLRVRAGSRLEIEYAGGCLIEFRAVGSLFRSVIVTAPGVTAAFGPDGGTFYHGPAAGAAPLVLDYRFELAGGLTPGTYPWPLTLTVLPM